VLGRGPIKWSVERDPKYTQNFNRKYIKVIQNIDLENFIPQF